MLGPHEQRAIEATLRRFAGRIDQLLFAARSDAEEGADGDLSRVPQLLAEARDLDLVADPAPGAPGHELGVWGTHCREEGLALSLLTLSLLAESCAGFATAIHAQGLACLALNGQARFPPAHPMAAAYLPAYGIPLRIEGSSLCLDTEEGTPALSGTGHYLLAAEPPQALVCFAKEEREPGEDAAWISLVVKADAPGLELVALEARTGLRATRQYDLHCHRVPISPEQILARGDAALLSLQRLLACDWLGIAAIALGVARRSLRDARAYTTQRHQGGRMVGQHAAVRLLQGSAEYDIALLEAILTRHAAEPLTSVEPVVRVRWALAARLAVVEHAHRAVSGCLQTLGGYGYMADYGLEKRLRDVATLKSLHGAPDQLTLSLEDLVQGAVP
jgi:alkylation response protein AidB-like acyl-CoA dehydrogenase